MYKIFYKILIIMHFLIKCNTCTMKHLFNNIITMLFPFKNNQINLFQVYRPAMTLPTFDQDSSSFSLQCFLPLCYCSHRELKV